MSSENRAAHALGRTFPGGLDAFVQQMNAKARLLGMTATRYVEPTGLSSRNQSSARDLAVLVNVAHSDPLVREYTTSPGYEVAVGRRTLQYNNTNRLVLSPTWDIGLQKTGYISKRVAAWSCRRRWLAARSSWSSWTPPESSAAWAMPSAYATGWNPWGRWPAIP